MASVLCGCSKKRRPNRGSVYVASSTDEQPVGPPNESYILSPIVVSGPPTTSNHVAPVAEQSVQAARRGRAGGYEHVERYVAGGGTTVTVSVRQHQRHQYHRQLHDMTDNGVKRQLSNYDSVLDEYLHAAMATQDANRCNQAGKVINVDTVVYGLVIDSN